MSLKIVRPDWEIVDEVDENTRVVRQVNKLSWPLSNRDMALASGRVEANGTHALIFRSVEHEKVLASINSTCVRAVGRVCVELSQRSYGAIESADGDFGLHQVPVVSKNVRANVLLSGFIFAPAGEGKSTLTRIIHVDPAGNIPSSVRPRSQPGIAAILALALRA